MHTATFKLFYFNALLIDFMDANWMARVLVPCNCSIMHSYKNSILIFFQSQVIIPSNYCPCTPSTKARSVKGKTYNMRWKRIPWKVTSTPMNQPWHLMVWPFGTFAWKSQAIGDPLAYEIVRRAAINECDHLLFPDRRGEVHGYGGFSYGQSMERNLRAFGVDKFFIFGLFHYHQLRLPAVVVSGELLVAIETDTL